MSTEERSIEVDAVSDDELKSRLEIALARVASAIRDEDARGDDDGRAFVLRALEELIREQMPHA